MDNNVQNNTIQPNVSSNQIPQQPQLQPQTNEINAQNAMIQSNTNVAVAQINPQIQSNEVINQNTMIQPNTNNITPEQSNIIAPQPQVDMEAHIKNQLQYIPTVEQSKQDFINNVQSMNQEPQVQKSDEVNFILFSLYLLLFLLLYISYFQY